MEPMDRTVPAQPEEPEGEHDLSVEDEAELRQALDESLEEEREGMLIPHEALFPPRRLTG
jgi:hypothetical protein